MNSINLLLINIISVLTIPRAALGCYSSIINFGDSISDTGNFILSKPSGTSRSEYNWLNRPNGETFFHYPTGRCSDGRLIIDFIAESLGLPLITPYLEIKKNLTVENFERGVNFAVVAATALDTAYLEKLGTPTIITNCSLRNQMGWFKDMLVSLCNTSSPSECSRQLLSSSLVSMGIGSNDYNSPLLVRRFSAKKVLSYLPLVVEKIALAINELIEFGASTILVSGNLPNGCLPVFQEIYANSTADEYNTTNGCLNWLNSLAEYHNERLQIELSRIRRLNPHVNLIYTDLYHAMLQLFESPEQFGFNGETKFIACCGAGGNRNNFKDSAWCGQENVTMYVCENPKQFISWDGAHSTEATYRWMAKNVLEGKYNNPPNPISTSCISQV